MRSRFNILNFFHEKVDDDVLTTERVLMTEWAVWADDALTTD